MSASTNKTNATRYAEGLGSKRRPRKKALLLLDDVLIRVLATTEGAPKRRRTSKSLKVFDAFSGLGPPFTNNAEPALFRKGVLTLVVEESAWLTELTFLSPDIIQRINETLGENLVTAIRARQGRFAKNQPAKTKAKRKLTAPTIPPPVSPYAEEQIESLSEYVKSPDLLAAIQRAARWVYAKDR
jgi:hypothetical protein